MESFGDKLYNKLMEARNNLWLQGEIAELTYSSFASHVNTIDQSDLPQYQVNYPIGFRADNTAINSSVVYTKEELTRRITWLANYQLPVNSIYQIVTITENMFVEVLKIILFQYPNKLGNKRKIDFEHILMAASIDEIKLNIIHSVINELTYKSPKDFASELHGLIGVNLLESPAYHRYIELKATRDIYIHNNGISNEIYLSKSGVMARVANNTFLPVDINYFLRSYEACIQVSEYLEEELVKTWPSDLHRKAKEEAKNNSVPHDPLNDAISESAKNENVDRAEKKSEAREAVPIAEISNVRKKKVVKTLPNPTKNAKA